VGLVRLHRGVLWCWLSRLIWRLQWLTVAVAVAVASRGCQCHCESISELGDPANSHCHIHIDVNLNSDAHSHRKQLRDRQHGLRGHAEHDVWERRVRVASSGNR
jgi:hypothetical protein